MKNKTGSIQIIEMAVFAICILALLYACNKVASERISKWEKQQTISAMYKLTEYEADPFISKQVNEYGKSMRITGR